jgi:hypothetical protein
MKSESKISRNISHHRQNPSEQIYKMCSNRIWTNVSLDVCSNTCFYRGHKYGNLYALRFIGVD